MASKKKKSPMIALTNSLLAVLLVSLSVLLGLELYRLNVLSTKLLLPILIGIVLLDFLFIIWLFKRKRKTFSHVICWILTICLSCGYGWGCYSLIKTGTALDFLTANNNKIKNVVSVYVMEDSPVTDAVQLNGKTVGVLSNINREGTEKLVEQLQEKEAAITTEGYHNFSELAGALYNGQVEAVAFNDVYLDNILSLEGFSDFSTRTRKVFEAVYYTDNSASAKKVSNITTEPFTVMVNGSDSRGGLDDVDRSDVNMLVTINPVTKVVLLVSIPRDAYVMTVCDPEYECMNGQYDKLTHTGIHTYNTTKSTIENFMNVDINYTFRANFTAVVDLVDALDGIDVDVAPGYAVDYFYTNDMFGTDYGVHEGINHLNGQAALCYARERYAYLEGDFQRIRNQQEVLTAIAKKAASAQGLARYTQLLDTIQGNFWTDLKQDEITDFIKMQVDQMPDWKFISYSLSGEPDQMYCAEAYGYAAVVILDMNTARTAEELIKAVKNGDSAEQIEQMIAESGNEYPDYDYGEGSSQVQSWNSSSEADVNYDDGTYWGYDQTTDWVDDGYSDETYDENVWWGEADFPNYDDPGYIPSENE